jgi:hypothetical protein
MSPLCRCVFSADGMPLAERSSRVALETGSRMPISWGITTRTTSPETRVRMSGYCIAFAETTKSQWDGVRDWALLHGYSDLPEGSGKAPDHPVRNLNGCQAVTWCNAASKREGRTPCYRVNGAV